MLPQYVCRFGEYVSQREQARAQDGQDAQDARQSRCKPCCFGQGVLHRAATLTAFFVGRKLPWFVVAR